MSIIFFWKLIFSDLLGCFSRHFDKDRAEIVWGGKACLLAYLVYGHIGVREQIKRVLDHNIVLVGDRADPGAPSELVE